ncbi:hypothetical protein V3C99_018300 [Haemonchus contortus]|uniref:Reverse transcriptase domain-containing protein n=1 Tax=Haemonchus contortus TaxID=6289 RepID=A0A7I4Z165_HAECO
MTRKPPPDGPQANIEELEPCRATDGVLQPDSRIRDIVELTTTQCGFMAGCSTIDALHAICLLLEKHHGKQTPVYLAFVNLEKVFDRVPRDVILYALRQHGAPGELKEWVCILHSRPKSRVQRQRAVDGFFHLRRSTPRLCVILTTFYCCHGYHYKRSPGAGSSTLLYADDEILDSEEESALEQKVQAWSDRLTMFGLRLNFKKTEYLTTDPSEPGSIKISGTELTRTTTFNCDWLLPLMAGWVPKRILTVNAAWLKWRSMIGVCVKKMAERPKSKIHRTVIRPIAIYDA